MGVQRKVMQAVFSSFQHNFRIKSITKMLYFQHFGAQTRCNFLKAWRRTELLGQARPLPKLLPSKLWKHFVQRYFNSNGISSKIAPLVGSTETTLIVAVPGPHVLLCSKNGIHEKLSLSGFKISWKSRIFGKSSKGLAYKSWQLELAQIELIYFI